MTVKVLRELATDRGLSTRSNGKYLLKAELIEQLERFDDQDDVLEPDEDDVPEPNDDEPNDETYSALTVKELRELAKERGIKLSRDGKALRKSELIDELMGRSIGRTETSTRSSSSVQETRYSDAEVEPPLTKDELLNLFHAAEPEDDKVLDYIKNHIDNIQFEDFVPNVARKWIVLAFLRLQITHYVSLSAKSLYGPNLFVRKCRHLKRDMCNTHGVLGPYRIDPMTLDMYTYSGRKPFANLSEEYIIENSCDFKPCDQPCDLWIKYGLVMPMLTKSAKH